MEFQGISRKHILINVKAGTEDQLICTVKDLGSRNGTYLNNIKLEGEQELKKGDVIKIGVVALKFIPKGDPERLTYDKLNFEANTDGLTKCYNKSYFNQMLDLWIKKSKITGNPLSLIIIDLDYFKKLNDTFGHDAGDFALKEVSKLIRASGIRDGDLFARYGGEEFMVLLPQTNLKQGFEIAERIRVLIAEHSFMYDEKKLPVLASLGVADYRKGVNTGSDLFKRVDNALYVSKNKGRNQVNFYRE
jgi:diguanylate cyclase (GGDEF)-like protein